MSKNRVKEAVRVTDHDVAAPPRPDDLAKLAVPLTSMLTAEFDEAQRYLRVAAEQLLLAALGRTIARTLGTGHVDVDVAVTGGFAVSLPCTTVRQAGATKALRAVHLAVAAGAPVTSAVDVHFSYIRSVPEPAYRQALPTGSHALDLRVYRAEGLLQMDWWYDTRRLDPYTVEELTEQFPLALIELTSEATPLYPAPVKMATADWDVLAGSR
jgi:hypothetical protein